MTRSAASGVGRGPRWQRWRRRLARLAPLAQGQGVASGGPSATSSVLLFLAVWSAASSACAGAFVALASLSPFAPLAHFGPFDYADESTEGFGVEERSEWSFGPCTFQFWEPCNNSKVLVYHFSSGDPNNPDVMDPIYPEPQNFDTTLTTHIIVHGYVGHVNFSATANIYKALLRRGGSNVLVVDWGRLATAPCYPAAVFNTLQAGRCTGEFLLALARRQPTLRFSDVHAVGFSLGAHVAAFASNAVQDSTGMRLGRITGLDPALPLFATLKRTWKLDASDADFVDILHTNVGVFGKIEAVGHADFYFNGGSVQPACTEHQNVPLCSHLLANIYFAESIESGIGFWGTSCPSYYQYVFGWCSIINSDLDKVIVGEPCNSSTRGVYFVETKSEPPYAMG